MTSHRDGIRNRRHRFRRIFSSATIIGYGLSLFVNSIAYALPQNGRVVEGVVDLRLPSANVLEMDQSTTGAVIDWDSFDIGQGETVRVFQPTADSWLLNRVTGGDAASSVLGQLQANGGLTLINPAGITVGNNARIDVGNLILSTQDIANDDFMAGIDSGRFSFGGDGLFGLLNGKIVNNGEITIADGGLAALVAPMVENNGLIAANLGQVALAGTNQVTVDLYGDDLIYFGAGSQVKSADGPDLIANTGTIQAAGGSVILSASVARDIVDNAINMSGTIIADSVGEDNGDVILFGGADGRAIVSGTISAQGNDAGEQGGTIDVRAAETGLLDGGVLDASGQVAGGTVKLGGDFQGGIHEDDPALQGTVTFVGENTLIDVSSANHAGQAIVWADDTTRFFGQIDASAIAGDGGDVEVSGKQTLIYDGFTDLTSVQGATGHLLLDPDDITISTAADSNTTGNPSFLSGGGAANIQVATLEAALASANVTVTTAHSITVANDINETSTTNSLTLNAGTNVDINSGVTVTVGGDFNAVASAGTFTSGSGSAVSNTSGDINLTANDFSINGSLAATSGMFVTGSTAFTVGTGGQLDPTELANLSGSSIKMASASGGSLTVIGLAAADTAAFSSIQFFSDTDVSFTTSPSSFTNNLFVEANDDIFINADVTTGTGNLSLQADFNSSADATDLLSIGANLTSSGQLNLSAPTGGIVLAAASNWNAGDDITVSHVLDGAFDLSITGNGIDVTMTSAVGGTTPLSSLNLNIIGTPSSRQVFLGNVTTTGSQFYNGDLRFSGTYSTSSAAAPIDVAATSTILLTADSTFVTTGTGSNIQFNAPIEAQTANNYHLTASAGAAGDILIKNVGATNALDQITLSGDDITLDGTYRTDGPSGHISVSAVTGIQLGADVTLTASGTTSDVTLTGGLNGSATATEFLNINATGNVSLPVLGATTSLEYLTVTGNDIDLDGNITTGANDGTYGITLNATDVILNNSVNFTSSAGAIDIANIKGTGGGTEAVTFNAPASTIDLGNVGQAGFTVASMVVSTASDITVGDILTEGGVNITSTGGTAIGGQVDVANPGLISVAAGNGVNIAGTASTNSGALTLTGGSGGASIGGFATIVGGGITMTGATGVAMTGGGSAQGAIALTSDDGVSVGAALSTSTGNITIIGDNGGATGVSDDISLMGNLTATAGDISLDAYHIFHSGIVSGDNVSILADAGTTHQGDVIANNGSITIDGDVDDTLDPIAMVDDVFIDGGNLSATSGNIIVSSTTGGITLSQDSVWTTSTTGNIQADDFIDSHVFGGAGLTLSSVGDVTLSNNVGSALPLKYLLASGNQINLSGNLDVVGSNGTYGIDLSPSSEVVTNGTLALRSISIGLNGHVNIGGTGIIRPSSNSTDSLTIDASETNDITAGDIGISGFEYINMTVPLVANMTVPNMHVNSAINVTYADTASAPNTSGWSNAGSPAITLSVFSTSSPPPATFCQSNPSDPSCAPGGSAFCAENPGSTFCVVGSDDFCAANPTDPACAPLSCLDDPINQCVVGDAQYCSEFPGDPICLTGGGSCLADPVAPCLPGDVAFCSEFPGDPLCGGTGGGSCLADPIAPCVPGDVAFCSEFPGDPLCGGTGGGSCLADPIAPCVPGDVAFCAEFAGDAICGGDGGPIVDPAFCLANPGDPLCQSAGDFCTLNPTDPLCVSVDADFCIQNPGAAVCQGIDPVFCAQNPGAPECGGFDPNFCVNNPGDPICQADIVDGDTGLPVDPLTGFAIDPVSGFLIDPQSGNLIDPVTGQLVGAELTADSCAVNLSAPGCFLTKTGGQQDFCAKNPNDPLCMAGDPPLPPDPPDFNFPPPPPPGGPDVNAPLPGDPPGSGQNAGSLAQEPIDPVLNFNVAARPGDVGVMDMVASGQSGTFQDQDDDEEEGTTACQCN